MTGVEAVPESISFPKTEEEILKYWKGTWLIPFWIILKLLFWLKFLYFWWNIEPNKEIDAFQTSLKQSKGKPLYTFYDGPPFATGKPHYGHLLAGTIKDTVTRYWHQNGYHVERRFGWDTHGLPVEHEIDKGTIFISKSYYQSTPLLQNTASRDLKMSQRLVSLNIIDSVDLLLWDILVPGVIP